MPTLKMREQITEALTAFPSGLASCEIEELTGRKHQSVSAMMVHMANDRMIELTGDCAKTKSGRSAKRWRLAHAV